VAASTIRAQPSQSPIWNNEKLNYIKYPVNKKIPGYHHSFFYKDENVIKDVSDWIRSNGRVTQPEFELAAGQSSAFRLFIARWSIPAVTSLVLVVSYLLLTANKIEALSGPKFDLADNVPNIQNAGSPVLEIDEAFKKNADLLGLDTPEVRDSSITVRRNATCVVEGMVTFFNWDTSFEINLHEFRMLSAAELKDEFYQRESVEYGGKRFFDDYQREIWDWNSSHGKQVTFLRQFRNKLSTPTARLAVRVWNQSDQPARVVSKLYAECSQ